MNLVHVIAALVFGLCCLFLESVSAADDAVTVEFYLAEPSAAQGLKQAKVEGQNDELIYLHESPILTREDIADASAVMDNNNRPEIAIEFTKPGQAKISEATGESFGKRLAIVVNGKVISAPRILSKINGGAHITGRFSKAEAEQLAQNIRPSKLK